MSSSAARGLVGGLVGPLRRVMGRLVGPRVARLGECPRWTFRRAPLEGDQVTDLADLRGRALLLQFIGLG